MIKWYDSKLYRLDAALSVHPGHLFEALATLTAAAYSPITIRMNSSAFPVTGPGLRKVR